MTSLSIPRCKVCSRLAMASLPCIRVPMILARGVIGAMMATLQKGDNGTIQAAQLYWDAAAENYEEVFSGTIIGRTRRKAMWRELQRLFGKGNRVLEINCGTGLDAVFLAQQGVELVACDLSPQMIEKARRHAASAEVGDRVEFFALATENLGDLDDRGLFDGGFSNFSGLNCVDDLAAVQVQLAKRLKPGAPLLLCMIGRFALWEIVWFLLHKKPELAFRRLREKASGIDKSPALKIHRPSVKEICSKFAPGFRLRRWRGIGIMVPPSYMEHWARRFPRAIGVLAALDQTIEGLPLFRNLADCVVLEFERVGDL